MNTYIFGKPNNANPTRTKKIAFGTGNLTGTTETMELSELVSMVDTDLGIPTVKQNVTDLDEAMTAANEAIGLLDGRLDTAEQEIIDLWAAIGETPDTWHVVGAVGEPAYQNNYVAGLGGFTEGIQFKRVGDFLLIRGSCSGGTAATIFTLPNAPTNYRPSIRLLTPIFVENAQSIKGAYIDTNGNFVLLGATYQIESCNLVLAL